MSSLTTLFVVGPEEYVEFNESMGSKAFLDHVWDQSMTPLNAHDTSASGSHLHSAGARISPTPPLKIEFPTILRIKGKGNNYKPTGKWISWQELKERNPLALKDPPSLDEFISRGGSVGKGEKIAPGGWLKGEKRFKVTKRKKDGSMGIGQQASDGWIGGSTESVYATSHRETSDKEQVKSQDGWIGGSAESVYASGAKDKGGTDQEGWIGEPAEAGQPPEATKVKKGGEVEVGGQARVQKEGGDKATAGVPRQLRKSRSGLSLSERLGMDELKESSNAEPMPAQRNSSGKPEEAGPASAMTEGKQRTRPPMLNLPTRQEDSLRTPIAQTPLSATHTPPQTPLKHLWRSSNRPVELPVTPGSESAVRNASLQGGGSSRAGGLLLDPGEGAHVLPVELQTPVRDSFPRHPTEAAQPTPSPVKSQIDQMLAKLRMARAGPSGGGSQESRWAVKETPLAGPVRPYERVEKEKGAVHSAGEKSKGGEKAAEGKSKGEEKVAIPTAPRALRETREAEAGKSSLAAPQAGPTKSLLERLSPAAVVDTGEGQRTAMGKKERKRGSRKSEVRQEGTSDSVKEGGHEEDQSNDATPKVKKEPILPPDEARVKGDDKGESGASTPIASLPVTFPPAAPMEKEPPSSPCTSASVASISTAPSTESALAGNETLTSINWADDEDDDAMPELPEEWTRGSQAAGDANDRADGLPAKALLEGSDGVANIGSTRRGSKRGGKGRGKREKEQQESTQDVLPRAPRGLRIAGRANGKAAGPRELFPVDGSRQTAQPAPPPRGPKAEREQARRDQRPHGRPRLAVGSKDAFSRLAKGSLAFTPTANAPP